MTHRDSIESQVASNSIIIRRRRRRRKRRGEFDLQKVYHRLLINWQLLGIGVNESVAAISWHRCQRWHTHTHTHKHTHTHTHTRARNIINSGLFQSQYLRSENISSPEKLFCGNCVERGRPSCDLKRHTEIRRDRGNTLELSPYKSKFRPAVYPPLTTCQLLNAVRFVIQLSWKFPAAWDTQRPLASFFMDF